MKKSIWVVHVLAECKDCSWETKNYKNGQAIAAIHAKKHGHLVHYEVGLCGDYDGRKDEAGN